MSTPPKWRDFPDVDSLRWFPHASGWSRDTEGASHQSATATSKRISAVVVVHKVPFHDPASLAMMRVSGKRCAGPTLLGAFGL